jgi:hypothetical protein
MPFIYPEVKLREDTSMHFTVQSPLFPEQKKQNALMESLHNIIDSYVEDDVIADFGIRLIGNDSIGEKIFVTWARLPKNTYLKDSVAFFKTNFNFSGSKNKRQNYLYLKNDSGITAGGMRYLFQQVSDTNSSRTIISKAFYKSGNYFTLLALTDTLTPASSLLFNFIETFTPSDTVKGESPFVKRNTSFFKDFASTDSAINAKAIKRLKTIEFDSEDVMSLKKIIDSLSWKTKGYLQLKQDFIGKLAATKDSNLVDYLKHLYFAAADTAVLQKSILKSLLAMQIKKSFIAFKDLITTEPPIVLENDGSDDYKFSDMYPTLGKLTKAFEKPAVKFNINGNIWYSIYDSLSLAKALFPDILQLINLDDYKGDIMELLTTMVDSGYVIAKEYEPYFLQFYSAAKQELKKEKARERQKAIAKTENSNMAKNEKELNIYNRESDIDTGNELLQSYAVLLLPYWDNNPGVAAFFEDLLKLKNKKIRFNIMILLLRNKKNVQDSVLNFYAAQDDYRIDLYRKLKKEKLLMQFPAAYNNQLDLVKSAVINASYYEKYDTLSLLDKLPVVYNNKKGVVYFFKYKNRKEEKSWKIVSYGMQPENINEFNSDNYEFTSANIYYYGKNEERKLDETMPVKKQLQQLLKIMLYKMHSSAAQFYDNDDVDKDIMVERVKVNRFED